MNDAPTLITSANLSDMETNQTPPTQRKMIGGLNCKPATQIDDLQWELENICNARGLKIEPSSEGFEVQANSNQIFAFDVVEKFKCETQSFTEHILMINSETDAGNYSAPRLMKNLRNAIKMLKSDDELFTACTDKKCDYCEQDTAQ